MANPGGLTDTQLLDLFHCLEVPYSTSYATMNAMGSAYVQTSNQPILSAAKNAILSYLGTMEAIAIVDLQSLLDEFHGVRTNPAVIGGGGIGGIDGVSISAQDYRDNIKRLVQDLVPYFKWHDKLAREQSSAQNGFSIKVNR